MKNKKYLIIVPGIIILVILTALIIKHVSLQENGVAIISGADGPTAVFLAGKLPGDNGEIITEESEETGESAEKTQEDIIENIYGENEENMNGKYEENKQNYKSISMQEAKECFDTEEDYLILDVRREDEYNAGHIPGAVLLPNESIGNTKPEELPDLEQTIYVYCRSGNRSKLAAEKLANMGYTNIIEIGGILDWNGEIEK